MAIIKCKMCDGDVNEYVGDADYCILDACPALWIDFSKEY